MATEIVIDIRLVSMKFDSVNNILYKDIVVTRPLTTEISVQTNLSQT